MTLGAGDSHMFTLERKLRFFIVIEDHACPRVPFEVAVFASRTEVAFVSIVFFVTRRTIFAHFEFG